MGIAALRAGCGAMRTGATGLAASTNSSSSTSTSQQLDLRGGSAAGAATAGVAQLGTTAPAGEHPLLTRAKQVLGSVAVGRESLADLQELGASVEVLSDAEYARQVGSGSIGNTLSRLADGTVTAKIRLKESAMRDPKLAAALLAHEIEHGHMKFEARSLAPGTEADAERREAAVKVALGIDPHANNS